MTGVVTKVGFTNPHGVMHIEVDKDGTKTEWILTTGSANTLQSLGFGRGGPNTVVQGDVVTIGYFPARNGKPLGFHPADYAAEREHDRVQFRITAASLV